jgi:hypothetical protein
VCGCGFAFLRLCICVCVCVCVLWVFVLLYLCPVGVCLFPLLFPRHDLSGHHRGSSIAGVIVLVISVVAAVMVYRRCRRYHEQGHQPMVPPPVAGPMPMMYPPGMPPPLPLPPASVPPSQGDAPSCSGTPMGGEQTYGYAPVQSMEMTQLPSRTVMPPQVAPTQPYYGYPAYYYPGMPAVQPQLPRPQWSAAPAPQYPVYPTIAVPRSA